MKTIQNLQLVQMKINDFRDVLDQEESNEQAEQICLKCRSVYGTLIQSLAFSLSEDEEEVTELYAEIPKILELIERARVILDGHSHTNSDLYLKSALAKKSRLISLNEKRSLEEFFEEEVA